MKYKPDFEFWWTSHFDNIKLIGITYLIAKSKKGRCFICQKTLYVPISSTLKIQLDSL